MTFEISNARYKCYLLNSYVVNFCLSNETFGPISRHKNQRILRFGIDSESAIALIPVVFVVLIAFLYSILDLNDNRDHCESECQKEDHTSFRYVQKHAQ